MTGRDTARTLELVKAGFEVKGLIKALERGQEHEGEGIITSIGCGSNWH